MTLRLAPVRVLPAPMTLMTTHWTILMTCASSRARHVVSLLTLLCMCAWRDSYEDNVEVGAGWRVLATMDARFDPETGLVVTASPPCVIVSNTLLNEKLQATSTVAQLRSLNRAMFVTRAYIQVSMDGGQHWGGAVPFTISHSPEISHLSVRCGPSTGGTELFISTHLPGVTLSEGVEYVVRQPCGAWLCVTWTGICVWLRVGVGVWVSRFAVRFSDDLGVANAGWQRCLDGTDLRLVKNRGGGVTDTHQLSLAEYAEYLQQAKEHSTKQKSVVVKAYPCASMLGQIVQVKCTTPPWVVEREKVTARRRWRWLADWVKRGGACHLRCEDGA